MNYWLAEPTNLSECAIHFLTTWTACAAYVPRRRGSTIRHVSHLFALHPGRQISPVETPELAKAARVTSATLQSPVANKATVRFNGRTQTVTLPAGALVKLGV